MGERKAAAALKEAIQDRRAAIIGPIRQEILSGIRDKAQFARIEAQLEPFRDEEVVAEDYVEAARLFNHCRDHGLQCGPVDTLLLALSGRLRFPILTQDKGMVRCVEVLQTKNLPQSVLPL